MFIFWIWCSFLKWVGPFLLRVKAMGELGVGQNRSCRLFEDRCTKVVQKDVCQRHLENFVLKKFKNCYLIRCSLNLFVKIKQNLKAVFISKFMFYSVAPSPLGPPVEKLNLGLTK